MEANFWNERWANNEIGFHQNSVTPLLARCWDELYGSSAGSVFVPLCGKSKDLLWLAERGAEIVGVELSKVAVESFFAESGLNVKVSERGDLLEYRSESLPITIYQGDFYSLPDEVFRKSNLVFDRAALIALPAEMRRTYVDRFSAGLNPEAEILLVTMEHASNDNPPFSLDESEVSELYADEFSIQRIGEESEAFRGKQAMSVIYRLTKTSRGVQC